MTNNIITEVTPVVNIEFVTAPTRIRANIWMCEGGEIVTGGPTVPGGYLYCLTCESNDCSHCQSVFNAWIDDQLSQEEFIPKSEVEQRAGHIIANQLYHLRPAGSLIIADVRPGKAGSEWLVQRTKRGWYCGCSDSSCEHRLVAQKVTGNA